MLAFSEKLTNPAMAIDTLERYPALDVFSLVGISVSPETFVAIAGATELLFGLLVISGAFPQVAVLVAMVPFNATLLLFGQTEMVGHLPVYGVFLALLVYGSSAETAGAAFLGYGVVISMTLSFWLAGCWMLTQARRLSVGSKYRPVNSEPGVPFEAQRPRPSPASARSPSWFRSRPNQMSLSTPPWRSSTT